jgi:hypothetical protein
VDQGRVLTNHLQNLGFSLKHHEKNNIKMTILGWWGCSSVRGLEFKPQYWKKKKKGKEKQKAFSPGACNSFL